jgi:lysosomal Pro-X carboxypeptidase
MHFILKRLQMCKIIDGFPASSDIVNKAFAAVSLYYNYTGNQTCFKIEDDDDPHGLSGWQWQVESLELKYNNPLS